MATTAGAQPGEMVRRARVEPALRGKTPRVERLYALLQERMTRKQSTWGEGLTVLDAPGALQKPFVVRRALAFQKVLVEMPLALKADDLVVGNCAQDGTVLRTQMPRHATAEEAEAASQGGNKIEVGLSHKTPYYRHVLDKGFAGLIADIDIKLKQIDARPQSAARDEKLALFEAMRIECQSVVALAHRYAELAEEKARAAAPERRAELLEIARVCRRVPEHPARTFHEAVQAMWFVHFAFFCTGTGLACGRLDQYLYPALKRELDAGTVTLERAQELMDCLWLRSNDRAQIVRENFLVDPSQAGKGDGRDDLADEWDAATPGSSYTQRGGQIVDGAPRLWEAGHRKRYMWAIDAADAINHWGENILLSGIRPDGSDGTNELTYICLNSLQKFALTQPVVTVRLHKGSPPELVARAAEVLKSGGGMPYVNNDDVLVPAYVDLGVTLEDARDYSNSNCWETMIEGRSDQELIRGQNFLLWLDLALHRGRSPIYGERMGPDTGDPRAFKSFDELMGAWKTQADHHLRLAIDHIGGGIETKTLEHSGHGKYCYNPLLSVLTLDCMEREEDCIRGGARYTLWHVMAEAVANAVDSMAAIKKLVFEEKAVTMDGLLKALDSDWQGYENLRRRFVARAPKFANGNDYADSLGTEMMAWFVERSRRHAERHPAVIFPRSVGTFSWYLLIGKEVAATPDGRRSREPVATNLSPAPGEDVSGPTAAIRSYLKMHVDELAAGAPIDLRFSASSLKGDAGTERLAGFIKAFVDLGGNIMTITVTDVEELKRAMKEPEKYRHLRVRMGGWSAYFVMLSKEQQLLHIKKVEHGLV